MSFLEVIFGLVIGLLTGGLSGYIVSWHFEKRAKENSIQQHFEDEKKNLIQLLLCVFA